jgi:hypothetical protein
VLGLLVPDQKIGEEDNSFLVVRSHLVGFLIEKFSFFRFTRLVALAGQRIKIQIGIGERKRLGDGDRAGDRLDGVDDEIHLLLVKKCPLAIDQAEPEIMIIGGEPGGGKRVSEAQAASFGRRLIRTALRRFSFTY